LSSVFKTSLANPPSHVKFLRLVFVVASGMVKTGPERGGQDAGSPRSVFQLALSL